MSNNPIGKKLRFFRNRAGLSQLDLETEIGLASGVISRIEKGKTNPTKETLTKIIQTLKLSDSESSYLSGRIANPVTKTEVQEAKAIVDSYMNKRFVFAYMVDERSRVWAASKGFLKFIGVSEKEAENLYGISLITLLLDDEYSILGQKIPADSQEEVLENLFYRTYREMSFMKDDIYYQEALKQINSHKLAKKVWKKVVSQELKDIHTLDSRKVYFKFSGIKIGMYYTVEPVLDNERFRIVEYIPSQKVLKKLRGG